MKPANDTNAPPPPPRSTLLTTLLKRRASKLEMAQTNAEASPRRSLSGQISAIGAKLGRALSNDGERKPLGSVNGAVDDKRSVSRGRDAYQSSGRGGLGNIRPSSKEPIHYGAGPDDFSPSRGRERPVDPSKIHSTGRGGAGNIRSPSRDAQPVGPTEYESNLVKDHLAADKETIHSSGRGGFGNISGSRSRSRDASGALHSSGRGGLGNIAHGDGTGNEALDAKERASYTHDEGGIHSTGRGGAANLTTGHPSIEHPTHLTAGYQSSGRGGAGNIRDRSSSREPKEGGASGGLGGILHKVTHPHEHRHEEPAQPTVPEE